MKRSALCVSAAFLLCLAFVPMLAQAQLTGIKIVNESVALTRTNYPSVRPLEGSARIYAGEWELAIPVYNYDVDETWTVYNSAQNVVARVFLDGVLMGEYPVGAIHYQEPEILVGETYTVSQTLSMTQLGDHEVLIQIWHGTEAQPQDTYSFNVTVVGVELSGLQASSRVVRALGDNSFVVSFTNGGNENMRQAVLRVEDPVGLTIQPNEVELGDVEAGESTSANFTVSSPADVHLGTTRVRFSLSFIDYAGVPHTEDVYGHIDVYRLTPTLVLTVPSTVENGTTVEITATLKDPSDNPIPNENITFTVGSTTIGTFKTNTGGIARASYGVKETGSFGVGASFPGSASYEPSSASAEFTSVPQTEFTSVSQTSLPSTSTPSSEPLPYWLLLAVVLLVVLVGSVAYLVGRRMGRRSSGAQARKNRHDG